MRFIGRVFLILGLLGAAYHFHKGEGGGLRRFTCAFSDDISCLTAIEPAAKNVPVSLKADASRCQADDGQACLTAATALTQMNQTKEAMHFAGKACGLRAQGGCYLYGRALILEDRTQDSVPAFMAGCAQNEENSCLALGQVSMQMNDVKSAAYAYEKACYNHGSLQGCQVTARNLVRQGKTDDAIRAALTPCKGQLAERCAPLLVQPAPAGEKNGSLRLHYLSRALQKFEELMNEDELNRQNAQSKSFKAQRSALQASSRKTMMKLQTLSFQVRSLAALQSTPAEMAAFLPAANAFSQTLDYYERALRYEMLFMNSGDIRYKRQAREAFASVHGLSNRLGIAKASTHASSRMPASTRTY